METIYSDGKTLEIERMLNITVFLPQLCHFCGEEIIQFKPSCESVSLVFHSLDGDHDNWEPSNKVPAHAGCHHSFHHKGKPRSEETKQKISKGKTGKPRPDMVGDKNPSCRPEVAAKISKKLKGRRNYWQEGDKNPNYKGKIAAKAWDTRRRLYGPTGRKPKEERVI